MKIPLKIKIPNIKGIKITKFTLPSQLKNIKLSKKAQLTAVLIIGVLAITVMGRKSPSGSDWENVLPDASIFGGSGLAGGKESTEDDKYTSFFFEVFDLIKNKYWNVLSDEQLGNVVKLAAEKLTEKKIEISPTNKNQIRGMIQETMKEMDDSKKKEFIAQLTDITLANLEPFGRSRLYTSKKRQELSDTVKNVNPNVNHYDVLKVEKEATPEKIADAYENKKTELNQQPQTEEVIQEKAQLDQAYEVLSDNGNKKVYDEIGANPTIENRLITPNIFYIHITKFSPTTVEELLRVMDKVGAGDTPDTLIIDLSGNIGGAIDGLPYFLGPFIGKDQYAYQFFSRGEKQDFKTLTGWLPSLVKYKKVVVITDGQVQSSAEVFAATLKKYNVGVLVGVPTKGWGTVESVFKVNNQLDPENEEYSVLLVHSLTLREDGIPIEGKGVEPAVNTDAPNWESELYKYFNYPDLVNAVRGLVR